MQHCGQSALALPWIHRYHAAFVSISVAGWYKNFELTQGHGGTAAGNASHLIPVELALKVASKIEAGEPFGCVVLLPMYSEGVSSALPCAVPDLLCRSASQLYS